jgi:uncharacterized membrane protein YphA (DoxX/SURF4 family)
MSDSGKIDSAYWALRIIFGLAVLIAGVDKFTNILANWGAYLSPYAARALPISTSSIMHIVGVVEIIVGLCLLGGLTRVFGYIAMIWALCIAANLISTGMFYDIAVRDILIATGAFSLAKITEARARAAVVTPRLDEYRRAA